MSNITSTRLTKKQSHSTKDAYCVRIERKDGKVIRYTNWDKDLTMSTRIDRDGASQALSSNVTYYSINGYTPSAINQSGNLNPSSFDLEGILNTVEQASGSVTKTERRYPLYAKNSFIASTISFVDRLRASALLDEDTSTLYSIRMNEVSSFSYGTDRQEVDFYFSSLEEINRIDIVQASSRNVNYIGVQYSLDNSTFLEISPMQDRGSNTANETLSITLPKTIECRQIKLIFGPTDTGSSVDLQKDTSGVKFYKDTTLTNTTVINRNEIRLGLYDFARIFVFLTDSDAPVEDEEKLMSGFWTETELRDGVYIAEVKSLSEALNTAHGRFFNAKCDSVFGGSRCGVPLAVEDWSASMFALAGTDGDARTGTTIKPTTQNGFWYKATTAGIADVSEPTWPTSLAGTVVDNEITWKAVYANTLESISVDAVVDSKTLTINTAYITSLPDNHFQNGAIEFTSGNLAGLKFNIKSSSGSTFTLKEKMLTLPTASDTVTLTVGCKKRIIEDCSTKFDNQLNYQGFPHIPGTQVIRRFGGQ